MNKETLEQVTKIKGDFLALAMQMERVYCGGECGECPLYEKVTHDTTMCDVLNDLYRDQIIDSEN